MYFGSGYFCVGTFNTFLELFNKEDVFLQRGHTFPLVSEWIHVDIDLKMYFGSGYFCVGTFNTFLVSNFCTSYTTRSAPLTDTSQVTSALARVVGVKEVSKIRGATGYMYTRGSNPTSIFFLHHIEQPTPCNHATMHAHAPMHASPCNHASLMHTSVKFQYLHTNVGSMNPYLRSIKAFLSQHFKH